MSKITKRDLDRAAKADAIIKRRVAIEAKVSQWKSKLEELQKSCPHYHSWYEDKGSSSCESSSYWREYECEDCGYKWHTDQSIEQNRKYPHAVKGYKRNKIWHLER